MSTGFEKDAMVVYGKTGVCCVAGRQRMAFGADGSAEYYELHPHRDPQSCVYVPCDNPQLVARMRPLLTKEEIDSLLRGAQQDEVAWIDDKNERANCFRNIVSQGDRCQLICLVRCLLNEQKSRTAVGKRLSSADESVLKECVRLVEEEFSLSLSIAPDEVDAYIRSALGTVD